MAGPLHISPDRFLDSSDDDFVSTRSSFSADISSPSHAASLEIVVEASTVGRPPSTIAITTDSPILARPWRAPSLVVVIHSTQASAKPWRRLLFALFHLGAGVMSCGGALIAMASTQTERMFMSSASITATLQVLVSLVLALVRPWFDEEPMPHRWTEFFCSFILTLFGCLLPMGALLVSAYIVRLIILVVILAVTLLGIGGLAGVLSRASFAHVFRFYILLGIGFYVLEFLKAKAI